MAQQSPLAYCKVWLMHGVHAQLSALAQQRQSLGAHRGWAARILHSQPSVSSQQTWHRTGASPHAGSTSQMLPAPCLRRNVMGCVRVLVLPVLDAWGKGMPVPTYQWQCGRGGSMLSPASLRASSHLGTDIAPQLQLGWGMQCAASSQSCPLGLK